MRLLLKYFFLEMKFCKINLIFISLWVSIDITQYKIMGNIDKLVSFWINSEMKVYYNINLKNIEQIRFNYE